MQLKRTIANNRASVSLIACRRSCGGKKSDCLVGQYLGWYMVERCNWISTVHDWERVLHLDVAGHRVESYIPFPLPIPLYRQPRPYLCPQWRVSGHCRLPDRARVSQGYQLGRRKWSCCVHFRTPNRGSNKLSLVSEAPRKESKMDPAGIRL